MALYRDNDKRQDDDEAARDRLLAEIRHLVASDRDYSRIVRDIS